MKDVMILSIAASMIVFVSSCTEKWPSQPDWSKFPNPDASKEELMKPAECDNRIVAHRFGASECGAPDNSIQALRHAMSVGAYGAECDAYITKDRHVVIAHANGICEINGCVPYKTNLKELRAAGKLSNGEQIPTLEDILDIVMSPDNCTRLFIDIKRIDYPVNTPQPVIDCARRICEIVAEKKAKNFVKLLCTGFSNDVMTAAWNSAAAAGLEIAMNSGKNASDFAALGFNWINISAKAMDVDAGGNGAQNMGTYLDKGIGVSVYNLDRKTGDANAVTSAQSVNWYVKNRALLKNICTNYPAWLMDVMDKGSVRYDGISTKEEFDIFASSLVSDPTGSLFADSKGIVHLKTDIEATGPVPMKEFRGTFDGNGHTISFRYEGDAPKVGLFGVLTGTVKNLNLAGNIVCTSGETVCGVIASTASDAVFSNCSVGTSLSFHSPEASGTVIAGGIAGICSGKNSFVSCTNNARMEFSSGSAFLYGGMAGTCTTDARLSLSDCSCNGEMKFSGTCTSSWNYVGGLVGKPVSSATSSNDGKDWRLTLERCSFTGEYIVDGGGKIRAGMLCSYANSPFMITACTATGNLGNTCAAARDFVAASMIGFVEKNVEGKIEGCTFNGRVSSVAGANNYIGGILGNTADNAPVVCDRCSTGSSAFVGADAVKSVGMLAGRPKTAGCSVLNCRIAGTINKAGTSFVISPSNLEDWMFIGSGTTAQVTLSGNTFNNDK